MTENVTQKLIVILGATTSGKTELSLVLAKKIPNSYIISADSRQIYKGLDIGTGKLIGGRHKIVKGPACAEASVGRQKVLHFHNIPHYMIDIVKPNQEYTVAQYQKKVNNIIQENKGKIPILVGGTGLYISAVIDGLSIPPAPPDPVLRKKLEKKSNENLFKKLEKLDPVCAAKIDPKNKRRLIRALEVCLKTGKPFSELKKKNAPPFEVLQIGIKIPRQELYERINKRVDEMIQQGLVKETQNLYMSLRGTEPVARRRSNLIKKSSAKKEIACPLSLRFRRGGRASSVAPLLPRNDIWNLPAMSCLGYKQIEMYLRREINLAEAIELVKRETRHYARRQMTWFKRDKRIQWVKNKKEAEKLVKGFLEIKNFSPDKGR